MAISRKFYKRLLSFSTLTTILITLTFLSVALRIVSLTASPPKEEELLEAVNQSLQQRLDTHNPKPNVRPPSHKPQQDHVSKLHRPLQGTRDESIQPAAKQRPPPQLGQVYDAPAGDIPKDFEEPLVYVVAGMTHKHSDTHLLYVFAQGTIRNAPKRDHKYIMEVTGCQVGDMHYPLLTSTTGSYVCELPHKPALNSSVTLTVSADIFKLSPSLPTLVQKKVKSLTKLPSGRLALPTIARWTGQADEPLNPAKDARYEICLMTQERTFAELLPDWIDYHRRLGVDRVYIYDNSDKATIGEMLRSYSAIEVIHWPYARSQFQAQTHFLLLARRRCEWVILIDVDERLIYRPRAVSWPLHRSVTHDLPTQPLRQYLRAQHTHGVSQIIVPPYEFGSSGCRLRPKKSPQEAYIHLTERRSYAPKPIVYIDHAWPQTHVHSIRMFHGHDRFHIPPSLLTPHALGTPALGLAHYRTRSWEELLRKLRGSRNSVTVSDDPAPQQYTITRPRPGFLRTPRHLRYTHFRSVYRAIMKHALIPPELRSATKSKAFANRPRLVGANGTKFVDILWRSSANVGVFKVRVALWKNWFNYFPEYHKSIVEGGVTCCERKWERRNRHTDEVVVSSVHHKIVTTKKFGTFDASSIKSAP